MKNFAFPLVVTFSGLFLFFRMFAFVTGAESSIGSSLLASLVLALLFSIPAFALQSAISFAGFLTRIQRVAEFERKHFSWMKKVPTKIRLDLRTYLRWSAFAVGLLFVSFFLMSLETANPSPSLYTNLALTFFFIMTLFAVVGQIVVDEREKAAYFLAEFSGEFGNWLAKVGSKPDLQYLEKALNCYQSVFTYYKIPNIRRRLAQIRLAIDRGTKEDIKALYKSMQVLSISIDNRNPSLFDAQFNLLVGSLDRIESDKKAASEIVASRRDRIKSLLREMKKPMLSRVLPTVTILMILYMFYALFGIKISLG